MQAYLALSEASVAYASHEVILGRMVAGVTFCEFFHWDKPSEVAGKGVGACPCANHHFNTVLIMAVLDGSELSRTVSERWQRFLLPGLAIFASFFSTLMLIVVTFNHSPHLLWLIFNERTCYLYGTHYCASYASYSFYWFPN
jgi:hypothetical protein